MYRHIVAKTDVLNRRPLRSAGLSTGFISRLIIILCLAALPLSGAGRHPGAGETIQSHYRQLEAIYNETESMQQALDTQLSKSIDALFDIDGLAADILGKAWHRLNRRQRDQFLDAFKSSLKRNIFAGINRYQREGLPVLSLEREKTGGTVSTLDCAVTGDRGQTAFKIEMQKKPEGPWRIKNVTWERQNLRKHYTGYCEELLDDYSFPCLIAELSDTGFVVLEDFESGQAGKLPEHWDWKDKDEKKHKPYMIKQEQGNRFLAADDHGESVILGKPIRWNLAKYPYLSFRWRGRALPEGGDERFGGKNDSCAAVYIIYKKKLGLIPESVKYVWSTTLPVGSATRRSGTGRPWSIVAESGEDHLGSWRTYVFNAYEAYRNTFGGNPPDRPIGIGLLTDANSTRSKASADYDDIRALRNADADSGVKNILKGE